MKLKLIAAISALAAIPALGHAQHGADRSEVNTKEDLGSCSRCSRRRARSSSQ
jgi:hypothetical protein